MANMGIKQFIIKLSSILQQLSEFQNDGANTFLSSDGASAHTTKGNLNYLKSKFGNRVISRFMDVEQPSRSPDLNPLDFYFWGAAQQKVYDSKVKTIPALKQVVNEFAASISEETIRKVCDNITKRVKLCKQENGGLFQHKLK